MDEMKEMEMLSQAVKSAKEGNVEGFENLYILTYQKLYQKVLLSSNQKQEAEEYLEKLYINVYEKIKEAPEDETIYRWMEELFYEIGGNRPLDEEIETDIKLREEKATTILIQIEERLGLLEQEGSGSEEGKKEEKSGKKRFSLFPFVISMVCLIGIGIGGFLEIHKIFLRSQTDAREAVSIVTEQEKYSSEETSGGSLQENIAEEKETLSIQLADQLFVLDENDKIVSSKIVREKFHEEKQQAGQWTYYLFQPAHEVEGFKEVLFRVDEQKNPEEYEIVAEGVKDYFIMEDKVYYVKDGMIEIELVSQTYEPVHFSYDIAMKEDGFYLVNQLGNVVDKQDGIVELEDMAYLVEKGRIKHISSKKNTLNGIAYYLDDQDGDGQNELCWQADSTTGIFAKEGIWIDSFCIVKDWIYYSVYVDRNENNKRFSKIYRQKQDGSDKQIVVDTFQGNLSEMYYSENKNKIYGEYMPDSYYHSYSQICSLDLQSNSSSLSLIADSSQRKETNGNDMMEFIGTKGNEIYCYWHGCDWAQGRDTVDILWTKPVILHE